MHPLLGQSWNNLGMALEGTDQLDEARRAYESAYAIWQRSLPADHINLAHALNNIGNIAREEGNLDGAFEHYQRALAIYEARKSARIDRARTVLNLARVEHARERYDKALEFARTAVSLYEEAVGRDHDQVTHALIVLTEIYFSQKQYAPAIEPLERVLTIRRRDGATTSPEAIGDATFFLSQALEHTRQDPARARRLAREAVTAYAQAAGRDPKLKTWLDDAEQWAEKLDRGGTPARTATLESP
jgi:tetratricopeptide (TPR) repeat protein